MDTQRVFGASTAQHPHSKILRIKVMFSVLASKTGPIGPLKLQCWTDLFKNGAKETRTPDPLHATRLSPSPTKKPKTIKKHCSTQALRNTCLTYTCKPGQVKQKSHQTKAYRSSAYQSGSHGQNDHLAQGPAGHDQAHLRSWVGAGGTLWLFQNPASRGRQRKGRQAPHHHHQDSFCSQ